MAERMPKLELIRRPNNNTPSWVRVFFDSPLSDKHLVELSELISLKFRGQLRRDPNAPQTAPAQPGQEDAAAERSHGTDV